MTYAAVRSEMVIMLLFFHCVLLFQLCVGDWAGFLFCGVFLTNHVAEDKNAGCAVVVRVLCVSSS